jgi:2'-5' RNA ligase
MPAMKLFVALDLPASLIEALASATLAPAGGVRLTPVDQMHVTVHFLGDANAGDVRRALESVDCSPCRISVCGVGRFRAGGGSTILYAGVSANKELLDLHCACGEALAANGIELERRRFVPHVTLARLKPTAGGSVVEKFLNENNERTFGEFIATRFVLYNSVTRHDGNQYETLASYSMPASLRRAPTPGHDRHD